MEHVVVEAGEMNFCALVQTEMDWKTNKGAVQLHDNEERKHELRGRPKWEPVDGRMKLMGLFWMI